MKKKHFLLVAGIVASFAVGYGAIAEAWPIKGRDAYRGYFQNQLDSSGDFVWRPDSGTSNCAASGGNAIPDFSSRSNPKASFLAFVKCKLNDGTAQERVGARFIIQTMRGSEHSAPTASDIADWEDRVMNPALSVRWNFTTSYTVNSFYQGCCGGSSPTDDAFYPDNGSAPSIVFGSGSNAYIIRRQCANPVGNGTLGTLPPAPPSQNFNIDGRTTISDTTVFPGQDVTWQHYLDNDNGSTSTGSTTISWRVYNSLTDTVTLNGNAGTFAVGQEKMVESHTLTIPASANPGDRFCRHIWFSPETEDGGNDVGAQACATVQYDFDLTPIINFTVNGSAAPGSIAEQGDAIQFTYLVNNGGSTVSQSAACPIYGLTRPGSYTAPTPPDSSSDPGYSPPPSGCPRTFPGNSTTTLTTETITAPAPNQTICRALWVNPVSPTGGNEGTEQCIRIVAKPYLKVYGGDVAAGSGLETAPDTCTNNSDAAIISWNKRSAGSYAGAGVQHAAFALSSITDFATGRGNASSINTPHWLSFANTINVNTANGQFGGMFGSVPCIPDYYADRPGTTSALPANVSAMTSGSYGGSGSVNISGGVVNPGEKIAVYVDGDVFINSNITYTPNWNYGNIPLFQLVVRGNIYIGSGVTQLDGVYIAQRNTSGTAGTIYTCATAMSAPTLDNGAFFNTCNSKLTVNGAFIANSVEFLRTSGTLSQSAPGELSPASPAGEVFNFNPALWIPQPLQTDEGADNYDAIISLPPVL